MICLPASRRCRQLLFALTILVPALGRCSPCSAEEGCAVLVPEFWTTVGSVSFNFTGLEERVPDDDFKWGLGTAPGLTDTIPYQSLAGTTLQFNSFTVRTLEDQDVTIDNTTFYNRTLYTLNYTLPGQSLLNGHTYFVSVQADTNGTVIDATSKGVEVATSTPQLETTGYIYNTASCSLADKQEDHHSLWACWDPFVDPVTSIVSYSVTAHQYPGNVTPLVPPLNVGLQRSAQIVNLTLTPNTKYYVEVTAVNAAGVTGSANAPAIYILGKIDGLDTVGLTFVVAGSIIAIAIALFLIAYFCFRRRYKLEAAQRLQEREKTKVLKSLMYSLVNSTMNDGKTPAEQLRNARNLAFVITDLQSSTAQAAASPRAFLKVQEIHDTVIREGIAKHNGYEINTEGDAFHIAFATVPQALLFAMETQYRLLDTAWPQEVLRLPACAEAYDRDGTLLLRGPRVRMGIHYAAEGTVAHRLHLLTKHRVFSGPGFQVAVEVGDAANGGQVLLTHDAWLKLEANMAAAGFPTIKQIGLFQLNSWPTPIWLYEVSQLLGRPLQRSHAEPRRIELVEPGWGLNIVPPPEPRESKVLTFVSMRLDTARAGGRPAEGGSIRAALSTVVGSTATTGSSDISPQFSRQLFEALATSAMQFRGYIHLVREGQGVFGAVFQQTLDAVRFAHAAQTRLLYTVWPNAGKDPMSGPVQLTPDGRLLFYGPRVAMAIHETSEFEAERVALPSHGQREYDTRYSGNGVAFAQLLARAIHGGQVVLSEPAWASVQDQLPGSSQVVSLGTHVVDSQLAGPMLLMEVMPTILARRHFPPPTTEESIKPGYRDSPDPAQDMALVFTRVARPAEVIAAEQARGQMSDGEIVRVLTAFNIAISNVSRCVRLLLPEFNGYECKEPEPGKFTLAFHTLEAAVRWASVLQKELLDVAWPEAILEWPECAERWHQWPDGHETLLWKGLRVRVGMASGRPQYRKPLNTGRADYYGSLPNLAARVAALAHPGQILIEATSGFREDVRWLPDDQVAVLSLASGPSGTSLELEDIELQLLGFYLLKGLDDAKPIIQANPVSLMAREYEALAAAMRVGLPARRHRTGSVANLGSFLSIGSGDSQQSGMLSNGPLHALARTGSRLFGSILGDLPPLSGIRNRGRSLPVTQSAAKALEEAAMLRPMSSQRSPWGSFRETLAERVRAVGEVPRQTPSAGSQRTELASLHSAPARHVDSPGSSGRASESEAGAVPQPSGSPDSDWHLPLRARSCSSSPAQSTGDDLGGGLPLRSRSVSLTHSTQAAPGSASPAAEAAAQGRSQSVPSEATRLWQLTEEPTSEARPSQRGGFPAAMSSPPALPRRGDKERHSGLTDATPSGGSSYAAEVAQTFAASRLSWPQGPHNHRANPKLSDMTMAPQRSLVTASAPSDSSDRSQETATSQQGDAPCWVSPSKSLKADVNAVGTPRELAPRSALQMSRQHGTGRDAIAGRSDSASDTEHAHGGQLPKPLGGLRPQAGNSCVLPLVKQHLLKGVNGSQEPFSGDIQRSSISEHSLDGLKPPQQDTNGLHMQPRSASGSSLRMSRFTARRNAVLDTAHRRQVAQQGLAEAGFGGGPAERTWSFATEGTRQSEIATVPEEAYDPEEVELVKRGPIASSVDHNGLQT